MEDGRVRDTDRDAAVAAIEAACADGQIIEADRDKRVELARLAQTPSELRMLTHDLEPASSAPAAPVQPAAPPAPPPAPPAYVDYGAPVPTPLTRAPTARRTGGSKAMLLVPIAVVLVFAVASIGGIAAFISSVGDSIEVGSLGGDDPDVLSPAGYQDLLDAIEDETGSTMVFSAVLYPTYAVVELPVDRSSRREESWYWDGRDLERNNSQGTSSFERTDLARIDPEVIVDLVEEARANVEDASSWYAIVRAPDDDRTMIWAYASNDYSESEHLGARRNGTVTYDSTKP